MTMFPEEQIEWTDALCARDKFSANTRRVLLKIEQDGHRAGWDSDASRPVVFRLERQADKPHLTCRVENPWTAMLRVLCDGPAEGDVGAGLQMLAQMAGDACASLSEVGVINPAMDFPLDLRRGYNLYGYAMRSEAWSTPRRTDDNPDLDAAVAAKQLHLHPSRIEIRFVQTITRDGMYWTVMRTRGAGIEVMALRPEGDTTIAGLVVNALGRLIDTMVNNPVPVPARGRS